MKYNSIRAFLIMHFGFFIYSFYTVLGKYAARYDFLSFLWIIFYIAIICLLGLYAILWQQVLKYIILPIAISNKAITIVWGMMFSSIFFDETITLKKIIGACIILCGIFLLSMTNETKSKEYPQ